MNVECGKTKLTEEINMPKSAKSVNPKNGGIVVENKNEKKTGEI